MSYLEKYPDGVRHSKTPNNAGAYLEKWLEQFRPYGYATKDDSWGELEKILDIVHRNIGRREAELTALREAQPVIDAWHTLTRKGWHMLCHEDEENEEERQWEIRLPLLHGSRHLAICNHPIDAVVKAQKANNPATPPEGEQP